MLSTNRLRRWIRAAALLAAAMIVAGPLANAAADPYVIYAIESQTGGLTFVGKAQTAALEALEAAVNKTGGIGGRPVKIEIADDQSNPQVAVELLNGIIAKNVPVFLGAAAAGSCNAMFPLVAKSGPVMYCMSNAVNPVPGGYGFSADVSNADLNTAGMRYFRMRGWTRVATITSTDATGQIYDRTIDAIGALPENKGMTIVDREHLNQTDVTATAQLAHIKASDAQVLVVGATGSAAGTVFHAISDVGLEIPVATGNGNATHAAMKQYAAFLPKQLYFLSFLCLAPDQVTDPKIKAALRTYFSGMTAQGIDPDGLESSSWDSGLIVVSALRKLGTSATAEQVRAYIANLTDFYGANGAYNFKKNPQRGVDESDAIIALWDPAKARWTAVSKPGGIPVGR